jgi:hypothetical protein
VEGRFSKSTAADFLAFAWRNGGARGRKALGPEARKAEAGTMKKSLWRWVRGEDQVRLYDVGIFADGTLHNPNGYPEDVVRGAISRAVERRHQIQSEAASRGAVTRARRREMRLAELAEMWRTGRGIGARKSCAVCGKGFSDPLSVARGVGPECWQDLLACIEALTQRKAGSPGELV